MTVLTLAALISAASVVGAFSFASKKADHAPLPLPKLDIPAPKTGEATTRSIVLAGGCFWCTEGVFEQLIGVKDVTSGYIGDTKETANYKRVCEGDTKQAEAIKITYDASKISFGELLQIHLATHDPTTLNRQGADVGTQYRSAIFYANDEEKKVAEAYIKQVNDAKIFDDPVVTTVEPTGLGFFEAETYHQNYMKNNPTNGYVCAVGLPKVEKAQKLFPDKIKK